MIFICSKRLYFFVPPPKKRAPLSQQLSNWANKRLKGEREKRACRGLCSVGGGGGEKKKERERVARAAAAAAAHLKVPLLFRVTCGGGSGGGGVLIRGRRDRTNLHLGPTDRQSQRAFQIAALSSFASASMGVFGRVWEIVRRARGERGR